MSSNYYNLIEFFQLRQGGDEGWPQKPEEESRGAGGRYATEQPAQRTGVRSQGADQPSEERLSGAGRGVGHGRGVPRRRVEWCRSDSVVRRRFRRRGFRLQRRLHALFVSSAATTGGRKRCGHDGHQRGRYDDALADANGHRPVRWRHGFGIERQPPCQTDAPKGVDHIPVAGGRRLVRRLVPRVDSVSGRTILSVAVFSKFYYFPTLLLYNFCRSRTVP